MNSQTKLGRIITCEHCGATYTEDEYEKLEEMGYNRVWNFSYRRCKWCKREITPMETNIVSRKGGE